MNNGGLGCLLCHGIRPIGQRPPNGLIAKLSKNLCVTHLPLCFHAWLFPFQVLEGQTHRGEKCNIPST